MTNNTLFKGLLIELENKIINGIYKDGDQLPSERKLSEKYEISRNIVRQVLAALREKGLIEIKPGKGAFVTAFNEDKLTENLQMVVNKYNGSIQDVFETREILENIAIMKAVTRRREEDLIKLKDLCNKMEEEANLTKFLHLDLEFHKTIAEATQNKIFSTLVSAFYDLTDRFPFTVTKYTNNLLQVTDKAQKEHRELIVALERKDEKLAMQIIKEHMASFKKELEFFENKKLNIRREEDE